VEQRWFVVFPDITRLTSARCGDSWLIPWQSHLMFFNFKTEFILKIWSTRMSTLEATITTYLMRLRKTELERERGGDTDAKGTDDSRRAETKMSTR
jgi:hypothetical protein